MSIYQTLLLSELLKQDDEKKLVAIDKKALDSIIKSAPKMYQVYPIPKRTHGHRVIAHPARPLKRCQRALNPLLAELLPVHDAAYAYRIGRGIRDNAKRHQKSRYLLKLDFVDFFNSITPELFFTVLEQMQIELPDIDKKMLTQLLFWSPSKTDDSKLILSVGAPSSPLISNFMMVQFDQAMDTLCVAKAVQYTRYADDIFFSTSSKNQLFDLPEQIATLLDELYGKSITINEMKTAFSSKRHNRHVTGVTLTNDDQLSLGRKRKRVISSLVHRFSLGILDDDDISHLKGLLSFARSIENDFVIRLEKKYNKNTLQAIDKYRLQPDE